MKKSLLFLLISLLLTPLSGGIVLAAEPTPVMSPASTDSEIRQAALSAVLEFSKVEILDLQLRLNNLERPKDAEFVLVYDTLKENLNDYLDLVESRIQELNSDYITADGVRVTADNFKKWRETIYDPGTRELFDFLIIQQGGSILSIVEARYEKVAADVEKLKVVVTSEKAEAFQTMLQEARQSVEDSKFFLNEARAMFLTAFETRHTELAYKFARIKNKQALESAASESLTAAVVETIMPSVTAPLEPATILDTLDLSKETIRT
ncbi:MAG: hypothetical protein Q7R62_01345, partial [bacterium]|nr:hypothetical protein [bacterium]